MQEEKYQSEKARVVRLTYIYTHTYKHILIFDKTSFLILSDGIISYANREESKSASWWAALN